MTSRSESYTIYFLLLKLQVAVVVFSLISIHSTIKKIDQKIDQKLEIIFNSTSDKDNRLNELKHETRPQ